MENDQVKTAIKYTTVCIDIYDRVYNLSIEHPSWEQKKNAKGKQKIFQRCIVKNAFTCTIEEYEKLKSKSK